MGGQPLNGFGGPQMHQIGMPPQMHAMSPNMMHHGPPPSVMGPQMNQLYANASQYRQAMVNAHKNNPNVQVPPGPGDPQSHMRGPGPPMGGRLGPPQPQQQSQQPKGMGGPMLPPGPVGMNGPPKQGGKEGEGDMNSGGPAPTPGSLLNNAPQRPPTASAPPPPPSAPVSMPDLPFDMSEMFTNGGGDFDFPGSLGDMELWFDPSSVQDGAPLDMK